MPASGATFAAFGLELPGKAATVFFSLVFQASKNQKKDQAKRLGSRVFGRAANTWTFAARDYLRNETLSICKAGLADLADLAEHSVAQHSTAPRSVSRVQRNASRKGRAITAASNLRPKGSQLAGVKVFSVRDQHAQECFTNG